MLRHAVVDATTSKEPDGTFNEDYCKWCYDGGEFRVHQPCAADRILRRPHGK